MISRRAIVNTLYREYDNLMAGKKVRFYKGTPGFSGSKDAAEKASLAIIRYAFDRYLAIPPRSIINTADEELFRMLKIDNFVKFIQIPSEYKKNKYQYIALRLYDKRMGTSLTSRTEYYYQQVLEGKVNRFPEGYFYGEDGLKKASICLMYAVKVSFIQPDMEFLYSLFSSDSIIPRLKKWKLDRICKSAYRNDPLRYLHMALPQSQESDDLYEEYKEERELRKQEEFFE